MLQEFLAESSLMKTVPDEVDEFINLFGQELEALNTDAQLAASMESAGTVVLAMPFARGDALGNPDAELPDYVSINAIPLANVSDPRGKGFEPPSEMWQK